MTDDVVDDLAMQEVFMKEPREAVPLLTPLRMARLDAAAVRNVLWRGGSGVPGTGLWPSYLVPSCSMPRGGVMWGPLATARLDILGPAGCLTSLAGSAPTSRALPLATLVLVNGVLETSLRLGSEAANGGG